MTVPRHAALRRLALALAVFAAALAAYGPCLRGGPIWDDDAHITRPELRSLAGLGRIWFHLGATQQYYPVLHSAFWVEHRLWGDAPLGYHLANVLLHATAACLFALVLEALCGTEAGSWPWFAALVFALHPVGVESVAWISEQKNTLSATFYLASALLYLRWEGAKGRLAPYLGASLLFVLALLSKSVTASLPAALLVALWWKRGKLGWRRDVTPLAPWLILGVASGLLTGWVERTYIGARGADFDLSPVARCLLAGRASWFYFGKLLWPANLIFIYPRWEIRTGDWLAWAPLLGLVIVLACLVTWARRNRGPLACALFFLGTLFPALGFINVYPFLFSYVADHFQYLASLGIIAGTAAAWARWTRGSVLVAVAVLAGLGVATARQASAYRDVAGLYRITLERNPGAWLADLNLGNILQEEGKLEEAAGHYRRALEHKDSYADTHFNLGKVLLAENRFADAEEQFSATVRLNPDDAEAHNNLGVALADQGRLGDAAGEFGAAIRLRPAYALAHRNLGLALRAVGRNAEGDAELATGASPAKPDLPDRP